MNSKSSLKKVEDYLKKITSNNEDNYFEKEKIIRALKEEEELIEIEFIKLVNVLPKFLKHVIASYIESNNSTEKINSLFHFWEGLYAFLSDLTNGGYNNLNIERGFKLYTKQFISFGSWKIAERDNLVIDILNEYNEKNNCNISLVDFFNTGNDRRNETKGHDSIRNKDEIYIYLKIIELEICNLIPFINYFFNSVKIFKIEHILKEKAQKYFYIKEIKNNYCIYNKIQITEKNKYLKENQYYVSNKNNIQSFANYNIIKEDEDAYFIHSGFKDLNDNKEFPLDNFLCFKNYTNAHREAEINLPLIYFEGATELRNKAIEKRKNNIKKCIINKIIQLKKENNIFVLNENKTKFYYEKDIKISSFKKDFNSLFKKKNAIKLDVEVVEGFLFLKNDSKENFESYEDYISKCNEGIVIEDWVYKSIINYQDPKTEQKVIPNLILNKDFFVEDFTGYISLLEVFKVLFNISDDNNCYYKIENININSNDYFPKNVYEEPDISNYSLRFKLEFDLEGFINNNELYLINNPRDILNCLVKNLK